MAMDYWREQVDCVILNIGDMIVDAITNQYGVLVKRERKISYVTDDLYFWLVKWSCDNDDFRNAPNPVWIEEYGLKMSISVGFYDLYPQT